MGILANYIGRWIYRSAFGQKWLQQKVARILPYLSKEDKILDLGCGNALLTYQLQTLDYDVSPIDIKNLSYLPHIQPVLYNGNTLPYKDNTYSKILLITVLHHTINPYQMLQEASRVGKELIIIEDVYHNVFQQYLTYVTDTLVNAGFSNMTYQNKTEATWEAYFSSLGLTIKAKKSQKVLFFFRQVTYYVSKTC